MARTDYAQFAPQNSEEWRVVYDALQQYADNQVELEDGEPATPSAIAAQALLSRFDSAIASIARRVR